MSILLSDLTTLRIGGPARDYLRCETAEQAAAAIRQCDATAEPALVLGGGSNVVVSDAGFDGTVIGLASDRLGSGVEIDGTTVTAFAGVGWDDLVATTVAAGLGGLECLSGIPGSAGATPVQNVGAYGVEVSDYLTAVQLYHRDSATSEWVSAESLQMRYRSSRLKPAAGLRSPGDIVLTVRFTLDERVSAPIRYGELADALGAQVGDRVTPAAVRAEVLTLRRRKGMVLDPVDHDTWSVGSFFTNPVVPAAQAQQALARIEAVVGAEPPQYPAPGGVKLSAGWLIERAGFGKGFSGGRSRVSLSTKHTLALTNRGGGTAGELVSLAAQVRDGVHDRFGVELHPEPVFVGVQIPSVSA